MDILAIEASSAQCSVAVSYHDQVFSQQIQATRAQAQHILPMIDQCLTESQAALSKLDAIALGVGPGSFTGLRLAMSVAQGLAYATELPIIPVSSLAVIAQSAYLEHGCQEVLVIVDAHMGEVYQGHYRLEDNIMQSVAPDCLIKPDQVKQAEHAFIADKQLPTAAALIQLALHQSHQSMSIFDVVPNYLRGKQAWKTLQEQ